MRKPFLLTFGLILLVSAAASGSWNDTWNRRVFPYFQTGGNWYTLLIFINISETEDDALYVRFCDNNGNFCSDTTSDTYAMGANEQLIISTRSGVGTYVPTTAGSGYVKYRWEGSTYGGDNILAYSVVYNFATGSGFVVPSMYQPWDWRGREEPEE